MFQFTIRDLILITVIVALYVGWVADRHEKGARIERLEAALKVAKINPSVNYDHYQSFSGRIDGLPIATEY